jgi:hypothetical protein
MASMKCAHDCILITSSGFGWRRLQPCIEAVAGRALAAEMSLVIEQETPQGLKSFFSDSVMQA